MRPTGPDCQESKMRLRNRQQKRSSACYACVQDIQECQESRIEVAGSMPATGHISPRKAEALGTDQDSVPFHFFSSPGVQGPSFESSGCGASRNRVRLRKQHDLSRNQTLLWCRARGHDRFVCARSTSTGLYCCPTHPMFCISNVCS